MSTFAARAVTRLASAVGLLALAARIHVLHRRLGADPVQVEGLQFEYHHRAGGVLGRRLVGAQPDLRTGRVICPQTRCARTSFRATVRPIASAGEGVGDPGAAGVGAG